ncbi:MAG: CoA-binding protein [Chloroflexota bacterium]|nr:MAG: CoA-binding protein [Chloroflexota bacterium]
MSTISPQTLSDAEQRALLQSARVIAVVGFSDNPERTSHRIGRFLQRVGYTVYPVNPTVSRIGEDISYPTLADVPEHIDIVNVFRRSEYLPEVVDDAIAVGAGAIWAQLGIEHEEAARRAREAGIPLVMNNCIMVTYQRLIG